jgi:hypothetical protein
MQNVTAYQAELDYRRQQITRDWRPLRARRAARAARNQVGTHDAA